MAEKHRIKMTTLCYLEQDGKYLMLHRCKKKEDANEGKWLGVGGHLESGESPEDCLLREVEEETGLTLTRYRFRGLVTFINSVYEDEMICLYTADGFEGPSLIEDENGCIACDEGVLKWIKKDAVPYLNLWEGDRIFLEELLKNDEFFSLKLTYDKDKLIGAVLNGKEI